MAMQLDDSWEHQGGPSTIVLQKDGLVLIVIMTQHLPMVRAVMLQFTE